MSDEIGLDDKQQIQLAKELGLKNAQRYLISRRRKRKVKKVRA